MGDKNPESVHLTIFDPERLPANVPLPVRVLGIDLGTTNSAIAEIVWSRGEERPLRANCIEVRQETETGLYVNVLVPSVVAIYQDREWVGEGAKRLRARPEMRRYKNIFYECKNHMGLKRTYAEAPQGFRSAPEIGARVLRFLRQAAEVPGGIPVARTVVTVPASFQLAQRQDTLRAASLAGLDLQPGDLLDEPIAAFLDFLFTDSGHLLSRLRGPGNLLVFDFGGGTCDVAIFRLGGLSSGRQIKISPLSVSRYHRLGGGDIDLAIVHEVLIPEVAAQNQIDVSDFDYDVRKLYLEPALLSIAENLKIGLCMEIKRLQGFGRYAGADKSQIVKTQPGAWPCRCPNYEGLQIRNPRLSAAEFEEILKPFLDTEFLHVRETEYRHSCSIFAPIEDALERAGLRPEDIDLCLLVGGSSLIPQVRDALGKYFPNAELLGASDWESSQLAVARGAAYHALLMSLYGKGLFQPIAHDTIALRHSSGVLELIPRGVELPFPGPEQFVEYRELRVPEIPGGHRMSEPTLPLRVEIVAGEEQRPVFSAIWGIPRTVPAGEPLQLSVSMDLNQCLHLELRLAAQHTVESFRCVIENPLTNVVNPELKRVQIEEIEENLRTRKYPQEKWASAFYDLARLYQELGQVDKAVACMKRALKFCPPRADEQAEMLNYLGILHGERKDWKRQELAYREAIKTYPHWSGPLFNLALSQFRRGLLDDAERTVWEALSVENERPPSWVLLGLIRERNNEGEEATKFFRHALELFGAVEGLSDWELYWLQTAAERLGDTNLLNATEAERRKRRRTESAPAGGYYPDCTALSRV